MHILATVTYGFWKRPNGDSEAPTVLKPSAVPMAKLTWVLGSTVLAFDKISASSWLAMSPFETSLDASFFLDLPRSLDVADLVDLPFALVLSLEGVVILFFP